MLKEKEKKKSRNPTKAKDDWNGMKVGPGPSPASVNREHTPVPRSLLFTLYPIFSLCTPLHAFPNMPTLSLLH